MKRSRPAGTTPVNRNCAAIWTLLRSKRSVKEPAKRYQSAGALARICDATRRKTH